jgi:hypothetical protein
MTAVEIGHTLHAHRARIKNVHFPNGGVFSITNKMQNGPLVEVATSAGKACWGLVCSLGIGPVSAGRSSTYRMGACRR